jgi:hypothetical protein
VRWRTDDTLQLASQLAQHQELATQPHIVGVGVAIAHELHHMRAVQALVSGRDVDRREHSRLAPEGVPVVHVDVNPSGHIHEPAQTLHIDNRHEVDA